MIQNVVAFFCGTGYYTHSDDSYKAIVSNVTGKNVTVLGYNGCQVLGGGLFAHGVEEFADTFLADLKEQENYKKNEPIHINLVGHSRGVLSALLVIRKIQNDPKLSKICTVTGDFRDPVPGNFQVTAKLAGTTAIANQIRDLSDCEVVKKIYITLQEAPIIPLAFDAVIPKFHHATLVEVETLPGFHDAQQRTRLAPVLDHKSLFSLGTSKSLFILASDGVPIKDNQGLVARQIEAYEQLLAWSRTRYKDFGERTLHYGGHINANNTAKSTVNAINWRHANLKGILPKSVLYTSSHPHYNYRKSITERYCDLTLVLDRYQHKHPDKSALIHTIKNEAASFTFINLKELSKKYAHLDSSINKAINYLYTERYFDGLESLLPNQSDAHLHQSINNLIMELKAELVVEIESGKTLEQIDRSSAACIAKNTVTLINEFYSGKHNSDKIIQLAHDYVVENSRLGRQWSLGVQILVGALICVAAAVVGAVIGAAAGFGLGTALSGPGGLMASLIGAFVGAVVVSSSVSASLGLTAGIFTGKNFFTPSKIDKHVAELGSLINHGI
ncbi:MAG: hypothetical protein WC627_07515 [Legionella sp.]|jgi:hypothetical protein